jgi:hypothetical protein
VPLLIGLGRAVCVDGEETRLRLAGLGMVSSEVGGGARLALSAEDLI